MSNVSAPDSMGRTALVASASALSVTGFSNF